MYIRWVSADINALFHMRILIVQHDWYTAEFRQRFDGYIYAIDSFYVIYAFFDIKNLIS